MADKARTRNLEIGTRGGAGLAAAPAADSAMGSAGDRKRFLGQVHKACRIAERLARTRASGPMDMVRIDSACSVEAWCDDPKGNQRRIAETFREACKIAEDHGERLAAEGEICWGGMHSWRRMIQLLEMVDRPQTLGFQADMAHTLLYLLGYNAPEDALLPQDFDWQDRGRVRRGLRHADRGAAALDDRLPRGPERRHGTRRRLARQDRPPLPGHRPQRQARHRRVMPATGCATSDGQPTKQFRHICWDGCMFPNATMMKRRTWNDVLRAMVGVRDAHGWEE